LAATRSFTTLAGSVFAIIDIETCGGKFEFRKGRITEICILLHDGLTVTDKYTTLVNPGCTIQPYYTKITGITNEMVADAPHFHEIAEKVIKMTEGCIFVAHNVGFDYSFIREEFQSLGYQYRRETLCTVRLSRKLMPGRISYSLGHLCASLGIEIFGRHRAEGDALATAELFDRLMGVKAQHPQYKNAGVEALMTRRVDKIKEYILKKIPEDCGVYYFLDKEGKVIYIGKSSNMYNRAIAHFNTGSSKSRKMLHELTDVDFLLTGSDLIALLIESEEIKKHQPKYNRMRRSADFPYCIETFVSKDGVRSYRIAQAEDAGEVIQYFTGYGAAREKLESWIEDHTLCLRYCGLAGEDAVCFNHQIRKCNGVCAGEEEIETYNKRASLPRVSHSYPHDHFILLDKGRSNDEYSLVLVENGRYAGYGYYENFGQVSEPDELRSYASSGRNYPDADVIVRQQLRAGRGRIIKLFSQQAGQEQRGDRVQEEEF
jgi:DNA polymerase III subunit epsilon